MVAPREADHELLRVTDEDATRLQTVNPKGRLLEWCAKAKLPAPRFEQDASPEGYRIRAVLSLPEQQEIDTPWFVAQKLKTAEQAAAEAALQQLPAEPTPETPQSGFAAPTDAPPAAEPPSGRNPAMILNELVQAGLLAGSGYEWVDQSGPPAISPRSW